MIRIATASLVVLALTGCAYETAPEEDGARATAQDLASSDAPGSDPTVPDAPTTSLPPPPKVTFLAAGLSVFGSPSDETAWGLDRVYEVYGTISMKNLRTGQVTYRNLGRWGNPLGLSAVPFGTAGEVNAPRLFDIAEPNPTLQPGVPDFPYQHLHWDFAKAALCRSSAYTICDGNGYLQNNNKMQLDAKPGDEIRISLDFRDYDWGSADDNFCIAAKTLTVDKYLQLSPGPAPIYWDKPYSYNGHVIAGTFGTPEGPNIVNTCYLHWSSPRP